MPDSIRELLQGIAGDEPAPSTDLAAGAYRRARRIGRRRFTVAAIGSIIGLALASVTTAALVNANGVEEIPSADGATAVELPAEPKSTPDEEAFAPTGPESTSEWADTGGCGAPLDWSGWGPSHSMGELDALPETLFFEVRGEDTAPRIVRFEDQHAKTMFSDGDFRAAPDGDRYVLLGDGECASTLKSLEGPSLDGLGIAANRCAPSWSPTSDRVVLNVPGTDDGYLLDVATGAVASLPAEVGCSPRWSADGLHLVSGDGSVAMPIDGSGFVPLPGADQWLGNDEFVGLSSISADLTRACLQFADEGQSAAGGADDTDIADPYRCDRYVDTATGETVEFPVEATKPQVVFLPDGSMIVSDHRDGALVLTFVDAKGTVEDERTLPGQDGRTVLRGYFTD